MQVGADAVLADIQAYLASLAAVLDAINDFYAKHALDS